MTENIPFSFELLPTDFCIQWWLFSATMIIAVQFYFFLLSFYFYILDHFALK